MILAVINNTALSKLRKLSRHSASFDTKVVYLEKKLDSEFIVFLKWIWSFKKTGRTKIVDLHEKYPEKEFVVLKSRKSVRRFLKAFKV